MEEEGCNNSPQVRYIEREDVSYALFNLLTTLSLFVTLFAVLWPTWYLILFSFSVSGSVIDTVDYWWTVMCIANTVAVAIEFMSLWVTGWNRSGSLIKFSLIIVFLILAASPVFLSRVRPVLYTSENLTPVTICGLNATISN
jgi:hypothetical protein